MLKMAKRHPEKQEKKKKAKKRPVRERRKMIRVRKE